jgi:hypothetical protein
MGKFIIIFLIFLFGCNSFQDKRISKIIDLTNKAGIDNLKYWRFQPYDWNSTSNKGFKVYNNSIKGLKNDSLPLLFVLYRQNNRNEFDFTFREDSLWTTIPKLLNQDEKCFGADFVKIVQQFLDYKILGFEYIDSTHQARFYLDNSNVLILDSTNNLIGKKIRSNWYLENLNKNK